MGSLANDIVKINLTLLTLHNQDSVYRAYQTLMDALEQTDVKIVQAEYWVYDQGTDILR